MFGEEGLQGPYVNTKPVLTESAKWLGPVLIPDESTETPLTPQPQQSQPLWQIQVDQCTHELKGPVLIGRHKLCGIRLRSPLVSGLHGLIYPSDDSLHYYDLATSNGSFSANGSKVSAATLIQGDTLRIGDKIIEFSHEPGATSAQVAQLQSPAMANLERLIARVAPSNAPVVILGESGVGKELVATAIHDQSNKAGPLITANAACFTPNLARSELFGHVAGAFTGARYDRQGLFSAAHGGTLFLDEVAEMSLSVQAELLRAIETGIIHPLGAAETIVANPRIIAASHKCLEEEVHHGRFREDLYYRLCVVQLSVPPLRERPEDVMTLSKYFVNQFSKGSVLTEETLQWLKVQPWSGNVRELRNLFWKASVLYPAGPTQLFNLKYLANGNKTTRVLPNDIVRVFFDLGQDVQKTAQALGVHRSTVHRHLKEYRSALHQAA